MIDINSLSREYAVRHLTVSDVDAIYKLCQGNTLYYRYCEAEPTKDQIIQDLQITPPGVNIDRKYYVGFYKGEELVAVMDLIDGFPAEEICFIGFFMAKQPRINPNPVLTGI